MIKVRPKLAVCSSASFYKEVIALSYEIEKLGIKAVLPKTAQKMKLEGRENDEATTDWSKNPIGYHGKALLIQGHFNEIAECDAILVTNYTKHGKQNYIGPNVLMEMAVAFFLKKSIYVLNSPPDDSPLIDEILGLEPMFLNGNIQKLKELLKGTHEMVTPGGLEGQIDNQASTHPSQAERTCVEWHIIVEIDGVMRDK